MNIEGTCADRFAAVRSAFEANFQERSEVGAAVCVTLDGETVVDLWGGVADPSGGTEWERDTISVIWSCTKGAVALCAHMLIARGTMHLDDRVCDHWPEFAKNGKDAITVRMLLAHQAGLAALREPIPPDGFHDWDLICERLAEQQPLWEPGTRNGYHALTYGHLVGELVRRVDGRSIGTFFREEVAAPRGLDVWIGLPAQHHARVARTIPADMPGPDTVIPSFYRAAMTDPTSVAAMVMMNSGNALAPGWTDTRESYAAEVPGFAGVGNARGLAGMYRALAIGGDDLVDEEAIATMGTVCSATSVDATLLAPSRWTTGFVKSIDNRGLRPGDQDSVIMSETAFGHVGMGGSIGFADPGTRMSFGYTMNKQVMAVGLDERGQSLIDAAYQSLGYRRPERGGSWYV
ncbi:MAG TPA: serine hydrolase domain-containing protein [Acidimicrobiia bacterium]|nr:serine hydrolase domain-containing protein [Acidimicrobiia bacterium]